MPTPTVPGRSDAKWNVKGTSSIVASPAPTPTSPSSPLRATGRQTTPGFAFGAAVFDFIHFCKINPLLLGIARTLWLLSQVPGQPRTASGVVLRCSVRCRQHLLGGFQALQRSSGVQKGISLTDVARVLFLTLCVFFTSAVQLGSSAGVTPQDALADNNPWDFCGFDGTWAYLGHGWTTVWILDVQLQSL